MRWFAVPLLLLLAVLLNGATAATAVKKIRQIAINPEESATTIKAEQQGAEVTSPTSIDPTQNAPIPQENKAEDQLTQIKPDEPKSETSEEIVSYKGSQVIRVHINKKEKATLVKNLAAKGEVSTWMNNGTAIDVVVRDPATLQTFKDNAIDYHVIIEDLQRAIQEENPQLSEDEWTQLTGRKATTWNAFGVGTTPYSIQTGLGVKKFTPLITKNYYGLRRPPKKKYQYKTKGYRLTWQMYHKMDDIHGFLDYLAATYPQNVTLTTIGSSVEGRPLKVLSFKSGQPNRPAIWVDAGIHAREWITPASLTYIMSQMIEGGDGSRNVDWYFNPLVNPDGYVHSHSKDRLWRKNRANKERGNCAGTDLNRNFGYKWGGQGTSKNPCGETYPGKGAFSEPETAAIQKFIASKNGQIKGYVSIHSYGQYILYPWGYDRKVPADYQDLERVGRDMAKAIKNAGGQTYTVGSAASTLYPAAGGSDDWAKGSAKIKYAYTLELRDTGRHGFVLPAPYIVPTAKDAYAALDILAKELAAHS